MTGIISPHRHERKQNLNSRVTVSARIHRTLSKPGIILNQSLTGGGLSSDPAVDSGGRRLPFVKAFPMRANEGSHAWDSRCHIRSNGARDPVSPSRGRGAIENGAPAMGRFDPT